MTRKWFLAAYFGLVLACCGTVWSQAQFLSVDDLRPGMTGIGKTCYQGNKPQEFQVEILGVMRRVSPGGDAVLARLSGGPLAQTGVFEGMSGSPVFIDGKLLGAVAFAFPFAKDAIAGITPIRQMLDAFDEGTGVDFPVRRVDLKKSMLWRYEPPLPDVGGLSPAMRVTPADARLQPALAPLAGNALLPIATPLSLGGFSAETLRVFAPQIRALGMSVMQGSGSARAGVQIGTQAPPLDSTGIEPGSNIVVALVHGDLDVSAGGTVTYVDGKKLYAFGHELFNLGFSQLPMFKGDVLTVFPSLQSSFKILETLGPIGTLRQDRSMGVFGILGDRAGTIPMRIRISTSRGTQKTWNFELAQDRFLTPFMINLTVFETILSTERALGMTTLRVKGRISLKGEQPIDLENSFASQSSSSAEAAISIAAPVNFLLSSGYKNLQFENINLDIRAVEDNRSVVLDSVRLDKTELKAGETLNAGFFYRASDGEVTKETFPVRIPSEIAPGPLSLLVADGITLMEMDVREMGEGLIPRDLTQLIRFINNLHRNDRLYVRLFRRQPGAVVNGEGLPGLPPSILSILRSDRNAGSMNPIQTLPLMEYELPPSEFVISGSKLVNLVINP
jgi:hypothetical protein